jgi:hypothetical protein
MMVLLQMTEELPKLVTIQRNEETKTNLRKPGNQELKEIYFCWFPGFLKALQK